MAEEWSGDPLVGIRRLQIQIEKAEFILKSAKIDDKEYHGWELETRDILEEIFGQGSPNIKTVCDLGIYGSFPINIDKTEWNSHRKRSLEAQILKIESLIELLDSEIQLNSSGHIGMKINKSNSKKVFLVHGHEEAVIHEVARFLEMLNLGVIILREQANKGRTIIEKFEEYADVGFAVVLLTPDDRGGLVNGKFENQKYRARQNVILELGYFLGRLGRSRVTALHMESVEIPSDYSGVLYIKVMTDGGWRMKLAKELKAAGFPIDMNKAV